MQHFDQDLNFHATEEDPVTKAVCLWNHTLFAMFCLDYLNSLFTMFCLQAVRRLILNIKPKDVGSLISNSPGEDPKMLSSFKDLLDKIFILDPEKRITVSQALSHPFITGKWHKMLIPLDIELSTYTVKYNLGSSCLIIDVSVLCPGSSENKYMDEARNYGRDGYLQTLLHALIIWIYSVACKTTSQLAFHSLYTIFPMDLQDIHESLLHFT